MNDAPPPSDTLPIEDYALIGDSVTAALVGRNGSVDWMCLPRFDGPACFAALLGTPANGRFLVAPQTQRAPATRRYRDGTLVLETTFHAAEGEVVLTDFMVPEMANTSLVRIVQCTRGTVPMRMELAIRFDYGLTIPWVTKRDGGNGIVAIAGPEMLVLRTPVPLTGEDLQTVADFTLREGERVSFTLTHAASHLPVPLSPDVDDALYAAERYWADWSALCRYDGPDAALVRRSLLTLKALTFTPTGGIVAAPTTSLPEAIGGVRNWDYRYCWLRDAVITLFAFMGTGYTSEAKAWARWLHRSVAGSPDQLQIMYGIGGERRLDEGELPWLAGYEGSAPVRTGNAAAGQLQLDVFGEVMSALHQARESGLLNDIDSWSVQRALLEQLERVWQQPDEGMWETRGGRKHFTFSKVMAWMAFELGIRDAEQYKLDAPLARWRAARDQVRALVMEKGFDAERNSFTQYFGTKALDASLLLIPGTGFLDAMDPKMLGTTKAIEAELMQDGFVLRYRSADAEDGSGGDGLPGTEGAFLACSFWLSSVMHMQGRTAEARTLFDRLAGLCNDVGLLSEEYDPKAKRFTGNFPQAFSHVALVMTALRLGGEPPPARG